MIYFQTLVFVDNLYTQESVVFNPVRSRRPGASGGDSSQMYVWQDYNYSDLDDYDDDYNC